MKFVTFVRNGASEPGVLIDTDVVSLKGAGFDTLLDVIAGGPAARARIGTWVLKPPSSEVSPLASVRLLAPIPRPPKIICVGLNYRDHAVESNMEIPKVPTIFSKYSTSVIGPGETIQLPRVSTKPDYEAEFAVVIGKGGRHIAAGAWQEHVFGYTILNDVSARELQFDVSPPQTSFAKSMDGFCPMGPCLATPDEFADVGDIRLRGWVNDEKVQDGSTHDLIFPVPMLIAYLSSYLTLEPGDIIATGTPAGVGAFRKPPRYLAAGDVVRMEIAEIGILENRVIAAD